MAANKYLTEIKYVETQKSQGMHFKEHPLYVFNITLFLILRNWGLLATFDVLLKIPTEPKSFYPDKWSAALQFLGRLKQAFSPSLPKYTINKELIILREQRLSFELPIRTRAICYSHRRGNGTEAKRKFEKEMGLEKLFWKAKWREETQEEKN